MIYIPIEEQKLIFAQNLQKYIRMSGKEQKQICADLGINEPTFSQWVNGISFPRDISTHGSVERKTCINTLFKSSKNL